MTKEMSSVSIKGQSNLLTCKDFNQNEIISFLDNQKELKGFIDETFSGLHVMFSPERDGFVIHNSSIITAPFSKDGKTAGALAYRSYEARLCEVYPISRVFHRKDIGNDIRKATRAKQRR